MAAIAAAIAAAKLAAANSKLASASLADSAAYSAARSFAAGRDSVLTFSPLISYSIPSKPAGPAGCGRGCQRVDWQGARDLRV